MDSNKILDDLEFSPDGPVRKLLGQREHYSIFRISLSKGLEVLPHKDSHGAFFLILRGKGVFTSGEVEVELGPNQYIQITEDTIRGIKALEDLVIMAVRE